MTRRERIVVLLEFWRDVEVGLFEDREPEGVGGMCRAWKHASYRELRRLLPALASERPELYRDLGETYLWYRDSRLVAWCPSCSQREPKIRNQEPGPGELARLLEARIYPKTWEQKMVGQTHKHGPEKFSLVFARVNHVSRAVDPARLASAVIWLDEHWREGSDPSIPNEIKAIRDLSREEAVAA